LIYHRLSSTGDGRTSTWDGRTLTSYTIKLLLYIIILPTDVNCSCIALLFNLWTASYSIKLFLCIAALLLDGLICHRQGMAGHWYFTPTKWARS